LQAENKYLNILIMYSTGVHCICGILDRQSNR